MKGEDGKMHASDDGVRAKLLAALAVMLTLGFASPGAAVTYISSCTNLNTAGETYLLTANIATSTFFCMNVTASGVTLDCQGYTISGGGVAGYAVLVDGNHDGVGVRNCRITNFSSAGGAGIAFGNGADNGHVANNTIITGHYGMYFAGINNTLASNTVSSNAVGIYVINSANGTVYNNTVTGSTDKGIYLAGSSWNNVSRNRVSGGSYGIVLNVSSFNAVSDNDASSGNYGIYIVNSPNNRLNSNNVTNANIIGVYLVSSSNNNLTDNIVAPANYYGLRVDSSSNVTLINNTVNQNYDGIYFVSSNYSNIVNNSASSNSHYGIVLTGSSYNNLTNNTASFNAAGITLGSSSNYNRLVENNASSDSLGMQISSSSHNILMSNVAQNNSGWDFYSLLNSMNNTVINLTTWQNRLSFTSLDIALKGLQPPEIPAGLPANRSAIGYAVNATNNSAASWLYINFSYSDSDWQAAGVNESTLRVWKHNASGWTNATFYSSNGVNTTANIVYANITNFASIFAPAGAADIISACSNLTSAGKTYVLNQSIAINGSGCIQVQADNITLDCRGYSIIGNDTGGTRGIEVSGQTNVTIRNCIVSDFGNGIYLSAMYGNVTNNTAISSGTGIYVAYSINSSVTNNKAMSNGWGFNAAGTSGSMFAGNNATSNSVGIGLYSNSVRNILVGNTLHSNHYGMYLSNSSNNSFLNTTVHNSTWWDFYSTSGSLNNTMLNLTTWQNVVSFASLDVGVKGMQPPEIPAGLPGPNVPLGYAVNATNNSAGSWLYINFSYSDADLQAAGVNESTLRVWKHNGTWTNATFWSSNGVDASANVVYANITNFGSVFAPAGSPTPLSACTALSVPNNAYALTQDVNASNTCMVINASNVTLDCAGHKITYGFSGGNYSWGVNITAPENMTLQNVTVKNCIIQKGSSSGSNGYGIRMRGVANSTLLNNTIRTNGTSDNYGIALEGAADNAIEGNSISTDGASQNHGIMLSPGNGTIELVSYTISPNYPTCNPEPNVDTCNVCFTTGGVTCASTGWKNDYEFECSPAHGCGKHRDFACAKGEGFKTETLLNFTLSTAVTGGRIIVIGGEDVYCQLNGNTILSFYAKNKCGALHQTSIPASAFTTGLNNLTCSVAGSGETEANGFKLSYFSYDLPIANESIRNRIEGNTIAVAGNDSHGILLKENSNLNTLASNNITAGGNRSDAVHVRDASGNVFENNTLSYARSGVRVVRSLASIFRNSSLTGSSPLFIDELEGYIEYTEPLSIATETNLSAVVSIARNATRVNSSHAAGSQLNKSAQLTFFNLPFLGSSPVVDFNDTGSFDACPQPQCKEVNDTYGTYIYNVSSFTTYAAKEETVCQVIDEPQEFEVLNDVIASGACFVIDSDDVTLDCNGYSIIGNGSGVGVIAFEATNITVKDCHISNFTIGVAFDTVSLSLISNVIIDRVASGVDFINVSGTSVRGVSVSNETYNATAGEFGIGMRFENSTWNVVDGFTVRFNASGNISYGMMLIDGMNANNTLANMSLESMATAGVYIKNGTGNTVIYSNISTPAIAGYGVLLALGASSNDMLWSNISTLYAGVHISFASNGNNISHNRISTLGPDPLPAVTIHDSSGETVAWNIIAANLSNSSYAAIQMTNATSSTVARNNVTAATGVALSMTNASNSNVIEHNRFTDSRIGIYLDASSSNSFANNTVYGNAEWDFYSWSGSLGNLVANLTSWQNVVSFESKDVALKGLLPSQAPANPIGKLNISRWVNATNNSADSWLFLNLSYSDEDVAGVRESTLKVWKHNASGWTSEAFWSVSDVSAGDNIVYANITDFGSTFGVFGDHLLSACGDLDTPNATYIMNQSIYVNGTCMNITADNVTLDCDGHSIVGNGSGYGIYAANRSHITAKRCVIANFTDALMLWNVSQGMFESNIVANNTAPYPAGRAFRVYFGSANSFVNNTVYNSRYPFQITTSTYNVIANNSASGNLGPGVWIDWQSNYNNITSNIFTSNGEDGIAIYHSYHNIIINNTAASNSRYGISFTSGSAHNTVINNTAQNNAVWDFFSSSNALNNTVINLITWQNRISFIALDICLRGMLPTEAPADPSGATNISKWVNATNNSADSWLFLNFSYSDGELGGANESKLRIAKHNASGWTASGFYQAGQWGVDEAANVAYANITNFESTFAPLADEQAPNTTTLYPANLSWQRAAFNVSISDYDNLALDESACYWRILDNGTQSWPTAGIAVPGKPGTWDTRTCSANVTVTVGPSSNCSTEGWAMCSVESFAIDLVGNVG